MRLMERKEVSHLNQLACCFCSPAVLYHPTRYDAVDRGSVRMSEDIHECFRDFKQKFIIVSLEHSVLERRLHVLTTFMWYASLHKYNIMVYWIDSKECPGEFTDGFQLFSLPLSDEQRILRKRMQLDIHVEFWMQGWDSFGPRVSQENCRGAFNGDSLVWTDFGIEKLREILLPTFSDGVPHVLRQRWEKTASDIHQSFCFNQALSDQASTWVSCELDDRYLTNSMACFIIDLDPEIISLSQKYTVKQIQEETEFIKAVEWVKNHIDGLMSIRDFPLIILTDVQAIYDGLRYRFGNSIKYGPFHESGFTFAGKGRFLPVSNQAQHFAVAAEVDYLYGFKETFGMSFLKDIQQYVEVFEVPFELPQWMKDYYEYDAEKCEETKMYQKARGGGKKLSVMLERNMPDLKGQESLNFLGNLPMEAQEVLQIINNNMAMSFFHKAVNTQIAMSPNNKLNSQQLGQHIGSDKELATLKTNRELYNARKKKGPKGSNMPGWISAVIMGPYASFCDKEGVGVLIHLDKHIWSRADPFLATPISGTLPSSSSQQDISTILPTPPPPTDATTSEAAPVRPPQPPPPPSRKKRRYSS